MDFIFLNHLSNFRIRQFPVFSITALFSILAYIWLLVVLVFISKDLVEVWEAVLTFMFFPILVIIAYAEDKGWLNMLLCQDPAKLSNKQKQIELGNFQTGECNYIVAGQQDLPRQRMLSVL
jgi:integral membrane sensor domain MASE1